MAKDEKNDILDEPINEDNPTVEETKEEFERDEKGNIIIPEPDFSEEEKTENDPVEEEEEEPETKEDDKDTEEEAEEESAEEDEPEDEEEPEEEEPTEPAENEEVKALRKKLTERETLTKKVLEKLGITDTSDIESALLKLGAESADVDEDEFKKEVDEETQKATAEAEQRAKAIAEIRRADLEAIKKNYPSLKDVKDITEIPNFRKFAEYRSKGIPAEDAFAASNRDFLVKTGEAVGERKVKNDGKSHLVSNVPKGQTKDTSIVMTKRELMEWRGLFPKLSDKEIIGLYKRTASNKQ